MTSADALQFWQLKDPAACLTEWNDFVAGVKNGHVLQPTGWAVYKQKVRWNPILLSLSSQDSLIVVLTFNLETGQFKSARQNPMMLSCALDLIGSP